MIPRSDKKQGTPCGVLSFFVPGAWIFAASLDTPFSLCYTNQNESGVGQVQIVGIVCLVAAVLFFAAAAALFSVYRRFEHINLRHP